MDLKIFLTEEANKEVFDEITKYISKQYSEMDIARLLDDEIQNWVDTDWEEDGDYGDEFEWYNDHNNGEAENEVIEGIIKKAQRALRLKIDTDTQIKIYEWMKDKYNLAGF